jgi:hypothetical protein
MSSHPFLPLATLKHSVLPYSALLFRLNDTIKKSALAPASEKWILGGPIEQFRPRTVKGEVII